MQIYFIFLQNLQLLGKPPPPPPPKNSVYKFCSPAMTKMMYIVSTCIYSTFSCSCFVTSDVTYLNVPPPAVGGIPGQLQLLVLQASVSFVRDLNHDQNDPRNYATCHHQKHAYENRNTLFQ